MCSRNERVSTACTRARAHITHPQTPKHTLTHTLSHTHTHCLSLSLTHTHDLSLSLAHTNYHKNTTQKEYAEIRPQRASEYKAPSDSPMHSCTHRKGLGGWEQMENRGIGTYITSRIPAHPRQDAALSEAAVIRTIGMRNAQRCGGSRPDACTEQEHGRDDHHKDGGLSRTIPLQRSNLLRSKSLSALSSVQCELLS